MYVFCNPNPHKKTTGDCVIRALSIALGLTWDEVYMWLSVEGFIEKDWGNINSIWGNLLRDFGFKRSVIPNTCPDCYTIADFAADNPIGTFVVATGSHVVAIIDGNIYDVWDSSDEIPTYYFYKEAGT